VGRELRTDQPGAPGRLRDVAFFDLFASAPPGFEEQGLSVVEEGLAQGADPVRIRRAARLLQGFELLYWDTMWEAAKG